MNSSELLLKNRKIYDDIWSRAWLLEAHNYNTWPFVKKLLESKSQCLEIAPGLRPRLPIKNTHFADISQSALDVLAGKGGKTYNASICKLPFSDVKFDLICALDIVEHVVDDLSALSEISRISQDGAILLISTPLHQEWWTPFDDVVGHCRRYEPQKLLALLEQYDFEVKQSAIFGMKPKSSFLVKVGMWFVKHNPSRAFWWYNRVFPFIAKRQKPLVLSDGVGNLDDVGEIFLVCERKKR